MLSLFSLSSWAGCTITGGDITDVARKQLELECLKAQESAKATPIPDAEKISAYAGIATEVATAIGLAAKNLGVEVNNFITTPAGLLTVAIILIKIFGKLFAMIAVAIVCKVLRHLWYVQDGDKVREVKSFFPWKTREVPVMRRITWEEADSDFVGLSVLSIAVAIISVILIPAFGL